MKVRNEERNVVSLGLVRTSSNINSRRCNVTYLHRLTSQDEERLRALSQESRKLMYQNILDFIRLLDTNANAHTIHTGLDQDLLALIAGHCERVQEHFGRTGSFDFGNIMSLGGLGCEIRYRKSRRQGGSDALEIRTEGL